MREIKKFREGPFHYWKHGLEEIYLKHKTNLCIVYKNNNRIFLGSLPMHHLQQPMAGVKVAFRFKNFK